MSEPKTAAAPESGSGDDGIPSFEALAADPEIAPLLAFEPVLRKVKRRDGWTPDLQRELIARIAHTGGLHAAVWQMGKHPTGAEALYTKPDATSFRASWDSAVAIGRRRNRLDPQTPYAGEVPGISRRAAPGPGAARPDRRFDANSACEDEAEMHRRGEEARDSISARLLRCRRLFLHEISDSPGKRAAFEILTELPVDWDKAGRLQPQPDEPWRKPNMHNTDMLLTAEAGWMGGFAHGPDKVAELRQAIHEHRAEEGLEPVEWSESGESAEDSDADA